LWEEEDSWTGWSRTGPRARWRRVLDGPTEGQTWRRLLDSSGADQLAVTLSSVDPNRRRGVEP
jgi:hypothetical protein